MSEDKAGEVALTYTGLDRGFIHGITPQDGLAQGDHVVINDAALAALGKPGGEEAIAAFVAPYASGDLGDWGTFLIMPVALQSKELPKLVPSLFLVPAGNETKTVSANKDGGQDTADSGDDEEKE